MAEAYVCGPPGLIESARRIWAEDGVEQLLHVESFLPPSLALASDRAEGSVSFAQTLSDGDATLAVNLTSVFLAAHYLLTGSRTP